MSRLVAVVVSAQLNAVQTFSGQVTGDAESLGPPERNPKSRGGRLRPSPGLTVLLSFASQGVD